jgi:hypothetical protein
MKYLLFSLFFFFKFSCDLFSQKPNTNLKQGVSQYYADNSDQPLAKWVVANKLIMDINGQNVNGYYGWAAQGESDYYFEGKVNGSVITGKKYLLSDGTESSIVINLIKNSASIISPIGKVIIPMDATEIFDDTKIMTIYEQPDFTKQIIKSDYELFNKGFTLIEIGKMEKDQNNSDSYNIWYKIKNTSLEGWVFGLIRVF